MREIIEELGFFFRQHKLRYLVIFVMMIISSVAMVIPARLVGQVVDEIVRQSLTQTRLMTYLAYFLTAIFTSYVVEALWTYFIFVGSYETQRIFRTKILKNLLAKKMPFYAHFRTGDLMTRASEDVRVLGMTTGFGFYAMMNATIILFTVVGMMVLTVSWQLALVALLPAPILSYLIYRWGILVDKEFDKAQKAISDLNNDVLEIIDGTYVVRAYGQEDRMSAMFQDKTQKALEQNIVVAAIDSRFMPAAGISMAISFLLGLGYGGYLVSIGQLEVGAIVSFQVLIGMTVWPVILIGDVVNVGQTGKASIKRIRELFQTSDQLEKAGTLALKEFDRLQMKHFTFTYPGEERPALVDISLQIKKGETLGIVGKTGAGKTTLIKQLLHQYPYQGQAILVNDIDLVDYQPQDIASLMAYVPQEHTLFSRSIRENMWLGQSEASDQEIWNALAFASFDQDVRRMPQQLDTLVGEKGVSLSGGQKQRLSIARAFLRDAEILILDDALSAVDAKTEQAIVANMKAARQGRTNLISSHRLSAIRHADWILVLDQGKIVDQGRHEDLLSRRGWYYDQYVKQELQEVEDHG